MRKLIFFFALLFITIAIFAQRDNLTNYFKNFTLDKCIKENNLNSANVLFDDSVKLNELFGFKGEALVKVYYINGLRKDKELGFFYRLVVEMNNKQNYCINIIDSNLVYINPLSKKPLITISKNNLIYVKEGSKKDMYSINNKLYNSINPEKVVSVEFKSISNDIQLRKKYNRIFVTVKNFKQVCSGVIIDD